MQTRTRDLFLTVRTEGAILPSDLLERIAAGDPDLGGLTPEAYHLPDGEKITETTNRAWNRLLAAWSGFRSASERLPATDAGTTLTREKWLLPLFQELGYGRLLTVKAVEIDGKSYAISHGWNRTPIHLLGCRVDLNTPSQRVAGASRSSPHSLLQEFLNRSPEHLWGIVSNGLRLRILRNNASLTRQSYVEFDLEAMMLGEGYSDFVLLWLLCHQSRVEAGSPSDCWLEKWSQSSRERGVRALEQLRTGVEDAITFLGRGFLAYPANGELRTRLRSGDLDAQDYYRQVLRLVYRLLFLFVAEDNATIGGLIRNAEVFGLFDFDADKASGPHVAFPALFGLVEELSLRASDTVRKQIKSARQMAPWLSSPPVEDGRKILIGGPGKPELLTQIAACLPTKKADDLVICSSSFDRELNGMRKLLPLSKAKPVCIVQPDHIEIDGRAVRKLGASVVWRPFADPYPPEKRQRKDVREHAKIFLFGHGATETCVFGSANASAPALGAANTEVVVVLPPASKGEIVKHLGLAASLKANSVEKELGEKLWPPATDERPESKFKCLLSAVAAMESGYRLSLASGVPPKNSRLSLSDRCTVRPSATTAIHSEGDSFVAHSVKSDDAFRFGWIVSESGDALSNPVGITWPSVGSQRRAGGSAGTRAGDYVGAMQDGAVLGTILFELLDQFRDFEVIKIGSGKRSGSEKEKVDQNKGATEQPAEFFYTDAKADAVNGHHWTGDRIDLDILASLVQPLSPMGGSQTLKDEDETYDDSRLEKEEAEHRQIEAQKGKATGEEKQRHSDTSGEKLEKAISRLERRLDRAAASIEKSLEHVEDLQSLAPNGVARQIWMTHIGAFLANRITESSEGEEFICLHPWCFANYVLRVCRALAGSKKAGGFLDKVAKSSWEGFDGDALTKGLSFLWTCVKWAAAYMVHYYSNGEGKEEIPESIAVASAELVAARFIWKVRAHCAQADNGNLKKRFPAWDAVAPAQMSRTETRLQQLAQLIADVETSGNKSFLGLESDTTSLKAGSLVHNPKLGVTMLAMEGGCRPYRLVDLSHSSDEPVKFGALVTPVLFHGKPYELFQRTDEFTI